jgi:hypothetical protein
MFDTVILAATGLLVSGFGITIWRGRTDLLAQYPEGGGPEELATRTGGLLTAYGLVTGFVAIISVWRGSSAILWGGWTGLTILVAFFLAGLAATSD